MQLHQCLRSVLLHGRERRRAPRRADGRAAHGPPGRAGLHHRQANAWALEQFQRLCGRARHLHARAGRGPRLAAGAQGPPRRRAHQGRCHAARRWPVGLSQLARARTVGHGDALHLRLCRARHPVPGRDQPRQQPAVLRVHCRHQPLRRAAAAALWLLRPRASGAAALCARALRLWGRAGV